VSVAPAGEGSPGQGTISVHNAYAVVGFETTRLSLAHQHRVIEVGLVHIAPDGTIED